MQLAGQVRLSSSDSQYRIAHTLTFIKRARSGAVTISFESLRQYQRQEAKWIMLNSRRVVSTFISWLWALKMEIYKSGFSEDSISCPALNSRGYRRYILYVLLTWLFPEQWAIIMQADWRNLGLKLYTR